MAIQISNVEVKNNPSPFNCPFEFEITFDCSDDLNSDLEWKIIYVGSAENNDHDQVLDSVLVGPVPAGKHRFSFVADSPDPNRIPDQDIVGVTVVLLTCSYREKEFVRVGYYVNNEYGDSDLREKPPDKPILEKLQRNILTSQPRVTKFKIDWDEPESEQPMEQEQIPMEQVQREGIEV